MTKSFGAWARRTAAVSVSVVLLAVGRDARAAAKLPARDQPPPPAVPSPARVNPREVPAAFSKPVPESMADLRAMEAHVKALVARVSPSVVAVEVGNSAGSGVVISGDGLVLTAGHVCGTPGRPVRFTFADGRRAQGVTMGVDRESDTGLMRITNRFNWPHAAVGDLSHARVGDWALALGHPGGFDLKRSLVVRLGRVIMLTEGALQTDCTISPGDSGGPLFDMFGRVVAIHSAISASTAENFHVPINQFYDDWDTLARGLLRRPDPTPPAKAYAGVTGETVDGHCRLIDVARNTPAARAGLKAGDVVLKVEGREIQAFSAFQRWISEADPGDALKVEVKRGDQQLSLVLQLAAPPATP